MPLLFLQLSIRPLCWDISLSLSRVVFQFFTEHFLSLALFQLFSTLLVSSLDYTNTDLVHSECGYQVLIGRPRNLSVPVPGDPTTPFPKHWVSCKRAAGAWWLNLILTYILRVIPNFYSLYVDFVFAVSLLQRNSHGRIRLPETEAEAAA